MAIKIANRKLNKHKQVYLKIEMSEIFSKRFRKLQFFVYININIWFALGLSYSIYAHIKFNKNEI